MQFYGIELLHKIKAPKLDKCKFKYITYFRHAAFNYELGEK